MLIAIEIASGIRTSHLLPAEAFGECTMSRTQCWFRTTAQMCLRAIHNGQSGNEGPEAAYQEACRYSEFSGAYFNLT